jgi:hypothetical protein
MKDDNNRKHDDVGIVTLKTLALFGAFVIFIFLVSGG